jgi:hypothetical protein
LVDDGQRTAGGRFVLYGMMFCAAAVIPAGDVDERAGRIRRLIRQQPQDRARDFDGLTAALHRQRRSEPIDPVRLAAACVDLGVDDPGPDAVDADPWAATRAPARSSASSAA